MKKGYGVIGEGDKKVHLTHRLSWVYHNGEIPDGLCVLHHCDNPRCVNPKHLFLGTRADNNKDMLNKGRARGANSKNKVDKKWLDIYSSRTLKT